MQAALPLVPYDPADPMVLESVSGRKGCCLETLVSPYSILEQGSAIFADDFSHFEKQLLVGYQAFVEAECLTVGHEVTMRLELPIINWVVSDLPSHKVGGAQQHSIIQGKWYIHNQAQAGPEGTISYTKKWPKFPWSLPLLHCLLYPSLHLWPRGAFSMISCQGKKRLGPGLEMVLRDLQAAPQVDSGNVTACLGGIPEGRGEGNAPSGQNFEQCT